MRISDVMTRDPKVIRPEATLAEAAAAMDDLTVGVLPVCDGTPNNGGPIVTAGGLIFIAATTDLHLRAIDRHTGAVLWSDPLPAGGQATPMTCAVDGRQFVVIAPGGHHFMETPVGDAVIAYALPFDLGGESCPSRGPRDLAGARPGARPGPGR